jgi:hypothetical protein
MSLKPVYIVRIHEELNSEFASDTYSDNHVFTDRFFAYKFMCDFLEEPKRKQKIIELYDDVPGSYGLAPKLDVVDMLNMMECNMAYEITHGVIDADSPMYAVSVVMKEHRLNPRYAPN